MFKLPNAVRRSERLIGRDTSFLMIVDMQAKLLPQIATHASIAWNIQRLAEGAHIMSVPHIVTEQYPEKLGGTIPAVAEKLNPAISKRMFSCRECFEGLEAFRRTRRQVVLCGIESHVCVLQTALDLVAADWSVFAVADAMGSRTELDHLIALQRLNSESIVLTTTEAVLFEWCETSVASEFRAVSSLVKQIRPQ